MKRALVAVSGNRLAQRVLDRVGHVADILTGIGAGDDVTTSGENAVFRALRARATSPYCVFDVGANQGQFLRIALDRLQGAEATVHCFEPGRETFRLLSAAFAGDSRVRLENIGLGRERGQATLHYDRAGSGLASLTKRRLDHHHVELGMSETVEIETLDAYCRARSIARIDLLKMDVEGHELDVLAGAKEMFAAKAIGIAMFEFGGCNIDTKSYVQDYWYFFRDAGFDLYRITPSGFLRPIPEYRERLERFQTTNFVAFLAARGA